MKLNLSHNDVVAMLFAMQYGYPNLSEKQRENAMILYQKLKDQLLPYGMNPNAILNQNREANLADKPKVVKLFYIRDNIGRAKYTVNFHDGVQTYPDGSPFYGIEIFHNKRKRDQFIRSLKSAGYTER